MQQRVAGVVVFEAETAKRIVARYFDEALPNFEKQTEFEKSLISKAVKSSAVLAAAGIGVGSSATSEKTKETSASAATTGVISRKGTGTLTGGDSSSENNTEIVLVDNYIVLLRLVNDVLLAVIARDDQNDLLIAEYISTLHHSLSGVLGNNVCIKKVRDRLDQVLLVLDESLERGYFFEMDPHTIVARINMDLNEASIVTPTSATASGTIAATASTAVREGIAAISRGDTDSLRSVFAGAAQKFSNLLGR